MGKFVIADHKGHYLREDAQRNYVPVDSLALAKMWDERYKAKNVLNNSINKNLRSRYYIKELHVDPSDESTVVPIKKPKTSEPTEQSVENTPQRKGKLSIKSVEDIGVSQIDKVKAEVDYLTDFIMTAEERKKILYQAQSEMDMEKSDIEHFIEFNDFDMYKAYILCKMLKERLIVRRKAKDEIFVLNQLGECKVNSVMLADMKSAIKEVATRKYEPRRLTYIFENAHNQWKI